MLPSRALLVWLLVMISGSAMADLAVDIGLKSYRNAQSVGREVDREATVHQVILGPLEKVGNELTPEASRYVQGLRSRETWLVPQEQRTSLVFDFYAEQLRAAGQVLFSCVARACGSSNHWANSVFQRRILYGPVQFQHYIVGIIDNHYLAIYVAQRATGQVYVHVDSIATEPESILPLESLVQALRSQPQVSLKLVPGEQQADAVAAALQANPDIDLYIVGHDQRQSGETLKHAMTRTSTMALDFQQRLLARGVNPLRLTAQGVGPLAPRTGAAASRLELVRITARTP